MKYTTAVDYKTGFALSAALLAMLFTGTLFAQGLPQTDIWLANINHDVPAWVSRINPGSGYNNQPHFSVDGSVIYYTREMPGSAGGVQTDIAAYDTLTKTTTMVNQTDESEYSPTPIPARNALSVIRVEPDQKQRLWAIDISSAEMSLLLPGVEPVGYHAWINQREVAMFILGESFTLQSAVLGEDGSETIADNIGRSIRKHPQTGEVLYVDKNREPWQIVAFNPATNNNNAIMPLFPAGEDFTIDGNGQYWTGNGSKLYRRASGDRRWNLVADLSAYGIHNITRLATSPGSDMIAIVSDHAD